MLEHMLTYINAPKPETAVVMLGCLEMTVCKIVAAILEALPTSL